MCRAAQWFHALWFSLLALMSTSHQTVAQEADRWKVNMTEGVTPMSHDIFGLHMEIFWWCVGIGVVVFGVMFYSMIVHRKSRGAKAANFHESTTLEIIWTIIPFIILIIMAIPATKSLRDIYDTADADMDIVITGYQWKWRYDYHNDDISFFSNLTTSQDQIHNRLEKDESVYLLEVDNPLVIPIKKKVRFLITANDVIHAWWVPDLAVKKDAIPGYINEAWTYVNEPGTYRGQCAELCGKDHGFMPIVVKALPQAEYDAWLSEQREAAAKERELANQVFTLEELMQRGEKVYATNCAACHQANGEGLPPTFPALKASPMIMNGTPTEHLDLVMKGVPGTAMQAYANQLSEVDMAAVITYERNAWGNDKGELVQPLDVLKYKQGQ